MRRHVTAVLVQDRVDPQSMGVSYGACSALVDQHHRKERRASNVNHLALDRSAGIAVPCCSGQCGREREYENDRRGDREYAHGHFCGPPPMSRGGPPPVTSTHRTRASRRRNRSRTFSERLPAVRRQEMLRETGVEPDCDANVTTRFITPMPLSRPARSTTLPEGVLAAVGSVHVEFAAQRAVMPTTRTGLAELTLSVQPVPFPRPSAIVTGTCCVPGTVV